jgi:DNA polymerase-3 subunit beta
VGGIEMVSKLIDGKYPDWRRVIPAGHFAIEWQLNREDLARALARARILSHEKFHGVALEVTADDPATLRVSATNAEQDQAEESVPLPAPSSPIRAGFNIDYVLGVLAACPGETIAWSLKDGSSGSKLTPATPAPDDGADNPEWVLMPMNM